MQKSSQSPIKMKGDSTSSILHSSKGLFIPFVKQPWHYI
jgi:hypothetical protein